MELTKNLTQPKILKSLLAIVLGSIALTISAKIKIPFYPVPMTMQTFVVLFLGISLGYKIGLATVGLYLFEGILGFPVFSNSPEKGVGLLYFTGPTMGYLIGFLTACYLASMIKLKDAFLNSSFALDVIAPSFVDVDIKDAVLSLIILIYFFSDIDFFIDPSICNISPELNRFAVEEIKSSESKSLKEIRFFKTWLKIKSPIITAVLFPQIL